MYNHQSRIRPRDFKSPAPKPTKKDQALETSKIVNNNILKVHCSLSLHQHLMYKNTLYFSRDTEP